MKTKRSCRNGYCIIIFFVGNILIFVNKFNSTYPKEAVILKECTGWPF